MSRGKNYEAKLGKVSRTCQETLSIATIVNAEKIVAMTEQKSIENHVACHRMSWIEDTHAVMTSDEEIKVDGGMMDDARMGVVMKAVEVRRRTVCGAVARKRRF